MTKDFDPNLQSELNPTGDPYLKITPGGRNDDYQMEHPAFGLARLARFQGGTKCLFQSNVESHSGMSIEICRASLSRSNNHDRVHGGRPLIRIELSPAQFAEFMTNPNSEGVPCTITQDASLPGYNVPRVPDLDTAVAKISRDFQKQMQEFQYLDKATLDLLKDTLAAIPKKHREAIEAVISHIGTEIRANVPYMMDCFQEATEKTLTQGKAEFAAFVEGALLRRGLESVRDQAPALGHALDVTPALGDGTTLGPDPSV
jgi:hypothetical protein